MSIVQDKKDNYRKICIVSHREDVDGIFSAGLLSDYLSDETSIEYYLIDIESISEVFNKIMHDNFQYIYVCDLCMGEAYISDNLIEQISNTSSLYVFDHHELSSERRRLLELKCERYIYSNNLCATKLLVEEWDDSSDYAVCLSEIAQADDYCILNDYYGIGQKLDLVLKYLSEEQLVKLVLDIGNKSFLCGGRLSSYYEQMVVNAQKDFFELTNKMVISEFEVAGIKVAKSFMPAKLYGKYGLTCLAIKKYKCDFGIAVYDGRNDVSIASFLKDNEQRIDVVNFCMQKGGGGRNNAGGYKLAQSCNEFNYHEILDIVEIDFSDWIKCVLG